MKRPDLEILFGPTDLKPKDVAALLLALLLDQMDSYLSTYYARMLFDAENDTFYFWDEEMTLSGRESLLNRIERNGSGRWSCDTNLGFYPVTISPAVFVDPPGSSQTTCVASIDSNLVRFLEESEQPRIPLLIFVVRMAIAIGAKWFLAGLELDHWRSLPLEEISIKDRLPRVTYAVGWSEGVLDAAEIAKGLRVPLEAVKRTTLGFRFVEFFPEPDPE